MYEGNYTRQRYAYVNFENDEDMVRTIDQQFEIKGCKLYWIEAEKRFATNVILLIT